MPVKAAPGYGKFRRVVADGRRQCARCLENLPVENFSKNAAMLDGIHYMCLVCKHRYEKRKRVEKFTPEELVLKEERLLHRTVGVWRCCVCKIIKESSEFQKTSAKTLGHRGRCRVCSAIIARRSKIKHMRTNTIYRKEKSQKDFPGYVFSAIKHRCKRSGTPFNLTLDHMRALWVAQGDRCCISGLLFDLTISKEYVIGPMRPSVDRIFPEKGYTIGNIRYVLWIINKGMDKWGEDLYRKVAAAVVENGKKLESS